MTRHVHSHELNMATRMAALGEKMALHPLLPNLGHKCGASASVKGDPTAYEFDSHRYAMAADVYTIPKMPTREKGAKDLSSRIKQRGSKTVKVTPNNPVVRETLIPVKACKMEGIVSA